MVRQIAVALDQAISGINNPGEFDQAAWPDVLMEIIRPLIRNMRDVRRYAASVHGTVGALGGGIAVVDVLALEAVRVFLPDVFSLLDSSSEALTTPSGINYGATDAPHLKARIEALMAAADPHEQVVRELIQRLFPAGARHIGGTHYSTGWERQWLRGRRVAHRDILRLYLERVAGEGLLAFRDAERAWDLLADRAGLDAYLRGLDRDRLQDVISALENYEDEFKPEQVAAATIVLLNLIPELPARQTGMFDLDTRLVVGRVTYRLLRSLQDHGQVEAVMDQILPQVTTLSSKLSVITDIGSREGAGHKLVSEEAAARYEQAWRDEVREASAEDLIPEHDLLRVLIIAQQDAGDGEPPFTVPDDPALTVAVLRASVTEVRGQTIGSRAVRRSVRLHWDTLVTLYGSEDALRDRVQAIEAAGLEMDDKLRALVEKYLSGWRPPDFARDDDEG
jgi:hypothetical protein